MPVSWTPEVVEMLKRLHADKLTFSEIANELSSEFKAAFTRSSCIGKAHRIGLVSDRPSGFNGIVKGERKTERVRKKRIRKPAPEVFFPDPASAAAPLHLSLEDLRHGQCKFPYGNGPFTFCGCQAVPDRPYCAPHTQICRGTARETAQQVVLRKRRFNFQLKLEVVAA